MQASLEVLRSTLEHAIAAKPREDDALRHAVEAFVDAHRKGGVPPERLLVDLKELARSALRKHLLASGEAVEDFPRHRELLDRMVRWAIERYYDDRG